MLLVWHSLTPQDPFERELAGPLEAHANGNPVIQFRVIQLLPPPGLMSKALLKTDISRSQLH